MIYARRSTCVPAFTRALVRKGDYTATWLLTSVVGTMGSVIVPLVCSRPLPSKVLPRPLPSGVLSSSTESQGPYMIGLSVCTGRRLNEMSRIDAMMRSKRILVSCIGIQTGQVFVVSLV